MPNANKRGHILAHKKIFDLVDQNCNKNKLMLSVIGVRGAPYLHSRVYSSASPAFREASESLQPRVSLHSVRPVRVYSLGSPCIP